VAECQLLEVLVWLSWELPTLWCNYSRCCCCVCHVRLLCRWAPLALLLNCEFGTVGCNGCIHEAHRGYLAHIHHLHMVTDPAGTKNAQQVQCTRRVSLS
jgi:hypothetical protein